MTSCDYDMFAVTFNRLCVYRQVHEFSKEQSSVCYFSSVSQLWTYAYKGSVCIHAHLCACMCVDCMTLAIWQNTFDGGQK